MRRRRERWGEGVRLAVPARGRLSPGALVAAVMLLPLALLSSRAVASGSPPVRSLAEIRQEGVVLQQWDSSCGAAALATLLSYDFGDPVAEQAVVLAMLRRATPGRVRRRGGFSLLDLQEYAEGRGYQAAAYGGLSLEDLAAFTPAIVPLRLHGYDHFVVVRRMDGHGVMLADPGFGRRHMTTAQFARAWSLRVAFVLEGGQ